MKPGDTKHTPGPWRVYRAPNGGPIIGIGGADGWGVTDPHFRLWNDGGEREANASLIAAAPDMLEALKENEKGLAILAGQFPDHLGIRQDLERTRAAIAKAEGRCDA